MLLDGIKLESRSIMREDIRDDWHIQRAQAQVPDYDWATTLLLDAIPNGDY